MPPGEASDGARPIRPAIRRPGAVILFVVIVASALAADLLSKHWVFQSILTDRANVRLVARVMDESGGPGISTRYILRRMPSRRVFPGVKFTLSTNPGVVFGLPMPRWAVAVATVLTVVLVVFFFATADATARSMHVALALVLAGAMGNLYDRLFSEVAIPTAGLEPIHREVRDFIDFSGLGYPWIFNGADVLLVVGAGILAVHWFVMSIRASRRDDVAH